MLVTLTVRSLVALTRILLRIIVRKLRLDAFANLDDREIWRSLQNGTGNQVTNAAAELLEDRLAAGFANDAIFAASSRRSMNERDTILPPSSHR